MAEEVSDLDREYHRELWRGLIIIVRAFMKRYGFKPPRFDD